MALPKDFKKQLLKRLTERDVHHTCERCRRNDWQLVDQIVPISVVDDVRQFTIPPASIPSAALICNHCGNIRLFSLGALGIEYTTEEEKEKMVEKVEKAT